MSLKDACRICLIESVNISDMQPLFEEKNEWCAEIVERIQTCTGIVLKEHEAFPKMICAQCLYFLNTSYTFRTMCQASESALLESILKSEMQEESQVSTMNSLQQSSEVLIVQPNDSDMNIAGEIIVTTYTDANVDDIVANVDDVVANEVVVDYHLHSELLKAEEINTFDLIQKDKSAIQIDCLNDENKENNGSNEFNAVEEIHFHKIESEIHLVDSCNDERSTINKIDNESLNQVKTATIRIRKRRRSNLSDQNRDRQRQGSQLKIHICDICGNTYSRRDLLNMHMRRHRAEKPYECDICGKKFICLSGIRRHIRVHTGEKPYICRYCGRTFADRSTNIKHERIHTNERPFICQTCGKSFAYSNVLKNHLVTHTGEKPFACTICNKTFSRKYQLGQHFGTLLHQRNANYKEEEEQ